jgi:hypothetical protein
MSRSSAIFFVVRKLEEGDAGRCGDDSKQRYDECEDVRKISNGCEACVTEYDPVFYTCTMPPPESEPREEDNRTKGEIVKSEREGERNAAKHKEW